MIQNASRSSKHPAHILLSKAHPPSTADAIFTDKVFHKPLHLRPTSPDPTSQDARAQRRLKRLRKNEYKLRHQRPKPLSAKEKRISGIYDIPKEQQKYSVYVTLHEMWTKYMWDILGLKEGQKSYVTAKNAGPTLTSADYHGSKLAVVRSKCVGMVGLEGIVVRDTKFTFQLITEKNELKTVPKKHTVFRFEIPQPSKPEELVEEMDELATAAEQHAKPRPLVFELYGSQFENRATDRATKKFKQRSMPDL